MKTEDRINITLSLPRELVLRLKHEAVDHGASVSQFVRELVERSLSQDEVYEQARRRQIDQMRKGLPMGLASWIPGSRDDLHER